MNTMVFFRREIISLFVIICALWAGMALAAGPASGNGPCADDAAKLCKDVQPGGGRMAKCLKEHEKDLSPACKDRIAEMKQRGNEFRAACEDEVLKLCKDVKPGGGRIINCLKEHENELSPECKGKVESRKGPNR